MKTQVFIFNYSRFDQSISLFNEFNKKLETFIINCHCDNDPDFKETDKIIKMPNVGYSGQWNKALELANCDVILIINSDVLIPNVNKLISRMNLFYDFYQEKAGIYAPNVDWTTWSFDPYSLEKIKFGFRKVPGPDSTIWSINLEIALQVGKIDLEKNTLGWGIENLASYFCNKNNKLVVRDYKVKCKHPNESLYSRENAMNQFENWIKSLKIDHQLFWSLYEERYEHDFGSNKDEKLFI